MLAKTPLLPFQFHRLGNDEVVAVSASGDFVFLDQTDLQRLIYAPESLDLSKQIELKAKYFLATSASRAQLLLLSSRIATKKETVNGGPTLHIFVITLRCAHTCKYCQVSRSADAEGYTMSTEDIDAACSTLFESKSSILTVEFQGGDPLLRFDLVRRAIDRITSLNRLEKRTIRFVIASTLHQLDEEMCSYLKEHNVFLSTSLDGPALIHNKNRPIKTRDAHRHSLDGIETARKYIGPESVSALMTATRDSLEYPELIVDEYVKLGFSEIFIRTLSPYGFAKRNISSLGYPLDMFKQFYEKAFLRVIDWNRRGVAIREVTAAIILNKILSPFDAGYVDLQSPTGAGLSTIVYNYDGYVYPSDEARMLAESGDFVLRLGVIGSPLTELLSSPVMYSLVSASLSSRTPGCVDCAFQSYCGPDPVAAHAQHGTFSPPVHWTEHCNRSKWLFDFLFRRLKSGDHWFLDLAYSWVLPEELSSSTGQFGGLQ